MRFEYAPIEIAVVTPDEIVFPEIIFPRLMWLASQSDNLTPLDVELIVFEVILLYEHCHRNEIPPVPVVIMFELRILLFTPCKRMFAAVPLFVTLFPEIKLFALE